MSIDIKKYETFSKGVRNNIQYSEELGNNIQYSEEVGTIYKKHTTSSPRYTSPPHLIMAQQGPGIAKRWCWTLNNPSAAERDTLRNIGQQIETLNWLDYILFGHEVGEQGTYHLQGYLILSARMRFQQINQRIWGDRTNNRIHWEVARGTPQQAIAYCKKDGQFEEFGEIPTQKVNQWTDIQTMITSGATSEEIRERYPGTWCAYRTSIESWINEGRQQKLQDYDGDLQSKNVWIWGPAGIGKSTKARTYGTPTFNKGINKWWDDYKNEPIVIIDDISPEKSQLLVDHLNKWLDRFVPISPKDYRLIITSNYSPEQCFHEPDLSAIRRRLTVIHMDQLAQRDPN